MLTLPSFFRDTDTVLTGGILPDFSKQYTQLCLSKRLCWWHGGRPLLMDVTIALKEKSKCRHIDRLEIMKWIWNRPQNCLFKGRGLLSLHWTEFICMSIDKNDLHCFRLSTTYRAIKKTSRAMKTAEPLMNQNPMTQKDVLWTEPSSLLKPKFFPMLLDAGCLVRF